MVLVLSTSFTFSFTSSDLTLISHGCQCQNRCFVVTGWLNWLSIGLKDSRFKLHLEHKKICESFSESKMVCWLAVTSVPFTPVCIQSCIRLITYARYLKIHVVHVTCQSLVDYGNLKGPSMYFIINWDQLGSAAVAACFPWGKQHEFPMGKKSHWDNKVEKTKTKKT